MASGVSDLRDSINETSCHFLAKIIIIISIRSKYSIDSLKTLNIYMSENKSSEEKGGRRQQ